MRNSNLDGSVPDTSKVALLLIDVINDLNFPESDALLQHAEPMAKSIAALKLRCKARSIPCVYVNDNFGIWRSDFKQVLDHCAAASSKGRIIAQLLAPDDDDYFVLKPKHSGFFSTTLDILLQHLQAETLILTGIAGNICVLFTANDAYMRDFKIVVPADCIASNTRRDNDNALNIMQKILKANTAQSEEIDFSNL